MMERWKTVDPPSVELTNNKTSLRNVVPGPVLFADETTMIMKRFIMPAPLSKDLRARVVILLETGYFVPEIAERLIIADISVRNIYSSKYLILII